MQTPWFVCIGTCWS